MLRIAPNLSDCKRNLMPESKAGLFRKPCLRLPGNCYASAMMDSAHTDSFVRDRLPPIALQPEFLFDLPELRYPDRLNAAVELIDRQDPAALALVNDLGRWTFGEMSDLSDKIARLLVE